MKKSDIKNGELKNNCVDITDQPIPRLFRVMECMATLRTPARLIDISKKLGMSQATVYRYVKTLCMMDYAYCDEQSGCYALTWKVCSMSSKVKTNLGLRSMASPYLNDLANKLNVSACLVVMDGIKTSYLDYVENPETRILPTVRIGHNAPIHTTGSGKVLLSVMSKSEVSSIVDQVGLVALTSKTITDKEQLLKEIQKVKKNGYAIDDEECEEGQRCVSVPLFDYTGSVAAAISIFDIVENMSFARIKSEILPIMQVAAEAVSYRLGFTAEGH